MTTAHAVSTGIPGMLCHVGTQGTGGDQGIFAARFDELTGQLIPLGLAFEVERPTWLTSDPAQPILYSVSEVGNAGDREGEVLSFTVDAVTGQLRLLGRTTSGGGGATHLALDRESGALFVANFGGGQVAAIPVDRAGGLSPLSSLQATAGSGPHRRQQGPHPHGVTLDPSRRFLLAPDMGADRVFLFRYDSTARTLSVADPAFVALPSGSGPRLLVFGRDGRFAYLLTELSAEVFTFAWDGGLGCLTQVGRIALDAPDAEGARSAAAIFLSLDGRFLYVSNRATGAIHVLAIDEATGGLTDIQQIASGGAMPWSIEIAPSGRWLIVANQASDLLIVFAVDRASGRLTPTEASLAVPKPTAIAFFGARMLG